MLRPNLDPNASLKADAKADEYEAHKAQREKELMDMKSFDYKKGKGAENAAMYAQNL